MKQGFWIPAALSLCILAGCTATDHTSFRHQPLSNSNSSLTAVDAKQRVIIAAREIDTTTTTKSGGSSNVTTLVEQRFKFCAEPSPDVFSVVAQALSAGGTFGQTADPKAIEAALSMAFSSSEQGSTIPRTQTINMLRELMYRTCERWLNGELGDTEMPIQAARDQRLMVSILAIEQLTGAVTPKPVVIGSSAKSGAGGSGADATVRIDDAYKALGSKTAAQQARQKEYDELNTGTDSCDALAKKLEAKEEFSDSQTQANEKCGKARTALANAKLERADAAAHHRSLIDASRGGGILVSAEASNDSSPNTGGLDRAHDQSVKEVALVVRDIVDMNFNQDEFLLFCLKVLKPADGKGTAVDSLKKGSADGPEGACIEYIQNSILRESARLEREAAEISSAVGATQDAFDAFWERIRKSDSEADPMKRDAAIGSAEMGTEEKACLQASLKKVDLERCFKDQTVTASTQRALAKGE